jgi:hypothetical protein
MISDSTSDQVPQLPLRLLAAKIISLSQLIDPSPQLIIDRRFHLGGIIDGRIADLNSRRRLRNSARGGDTIRSSRCSFAKVGSHQWKLAILFNGFESLATVSISGMREAR